MLSSVAITTVIIVVSLFHKTVTDHLNEEHTQTLAEISDYKLARYKSNVEYTKKSANKMIERYNNFQILTDVRVVLQNNADEYDQMEGQLRKFYREVSVCGLSNCGNFTLLFPPKCFKKFQCKKMKSKGLNNLTKKHLSKIMCGAQIFAKMFQQLIDFEESPKFRQPERIRKGRIHLLEKFKTSMNRLKNELNVTDHVKPYNWEQGPQVAQKSKNDLILNEWRLIQMSKNATREYLVKVDEIKKCWTQYGTVNDFE